MTVKKTYVLFVAQVFFLITQIKRDLFEKRIIFFLRLWSNYSVLFAQ